MIIYTWRKKAEYPAMKEDRESNTTCFFRFYKMNTLNRISMLIRLGVSTLYPLPGSKECTCSMDIW